MNFFISNYKAILFPVGVVTIFFFDQVIMKLPLELTVLKIFFISILHLLLVFRTNYLYDSDVYAYLSALKAERQKCFIIKPILSKLQTIIVFWLTLILFVIVSQCSLGDYTTVSYGLLLFFFSILFLNSINEILRNLTNRVDFNRIKVPASLSQRRYVISALQFGTKVTPICLNTIKVFGAGIGLSEVGIPLVTGGPNAIGPGTCWITNRMYAHNDMTCPIVTRLDVIAEHAYHINEKSFKDGLIKENPMGKRMFPLTTPKQLFKLGIDPGFPFSK
jgi:hypothetical protein